MIDEKKIQGAVNNYIGHAPEIDEGIYVASERKAFKDGANWAISEFLKELWHDASEKPKNNAQCVVYASFEYDEYPEDNFSDYTVSTYNNGWYEDYFPSEADVIIKKWCYISDLLPKGGEQ